MRDLRWLFLLLIIVSMGVLPKSKLFGRFASLIMMVGLTLAALSKFYWFEWNGVDFSHFDWMLHSTAYLGRFMWSPLCNCDHFGVHPTWLMLVLVPLHWIWASPWLLVTVHIVSFLGALLLLARLTRNVFPSLSSLEQRLIGLAFVSSSAFGSIYNYGFHYEIWYLPLGFWFLERWHMQSRLWILAAALFTLVKEDGALYLAGWGALGSLTQRNRRREYLGLLVGCAVFFWVNTKLLQPLFWPTGGFIPSWSHFWSRYGTTPTSIIWGIITQPLSALRDVWQSGFLMWLLPFAFSPFINLQVIGVLLPGILMLALSESAQMQGVSLYYAAPMLPFVMFSWLQLMSRFREQNFQYKNFMTGLCLILLAVGGGVGPRVAKLRAAERTDFENFFADWQKNKRPICIQTALFPHVGYEEAVTPLLNEQCEGQVVVHSKLDPYPFSSREDLKDTARRLGWVDLAGP